MRGQKCNGNGGRHQVATAGEVLGLCRLNRYVQLAVYPKDLMVSFGWWLPSSIDLYFGSANMVALGLICSVRWQHLALFEGHCDSSLNRQFRRHHLLIHCADCVCMVSWTKWWHSLRWVSLLMLPMRKVSWVGTLYRYMTWGCSINWFKMCNFPVCLLLPSALEECHHCS